MAEITMKVQMDPEKLAAMDKAQEDLKTTFSELDTNLWALRRTIMELEFQVKRVEDSDKLHDNFETFYNDQTMFKVAEGLRAAHLDEEQITDAINQMQNRGIFFRERLDG